MHCVNSVIRPLLRSQGGNIISEGEISVYQLSGLYQTSQVGLVICEIFARKSSAKAASLDFMTACFHLW
jgi:hypothetical protein